MKKITMKGMTMNYAPFLAPFSEEALPVQNQSIVSELPLDTLSFSELEVRYRSAMARLVDAQQEKMEASVEFFDIRAELCSRLETFWPGREEA